MKRLILLVLAYILSLSHANAQYQIRIKTASIKDTTAFFRGVVFDDKNYLAKDTVNLSKGTAVIKWKKPIIGGIYYFYFPISKQKVYFILENKDSLNFEFKGDHLLDSVITNKQKNINFIKYQLLETSLSTYDSLLAHEIAKGKKINLAQKANFLKPKTTALIQFRMTELKKMNVNDVLYIHYNTLNKLDSSVPNRKNYFGRHQFLKSFNYNNPKLLFTPHLKSILTEYFSYFPLESDSILVAADALLENIDCENKAYGYVFDYCLRLFKNREVLNNTDGYIAFINKYVKDKPCKSLDTKIKKQLLEEIANNTRFKLHDTSVNIILKDSADVTQDMHVFTKKYQFTLIVFYDPNCEHCKIEVPKMDSVITALEKQYVLNIGRFAICNAAINNKSEWVNFIHEHQLVNNYMHVSMGAANDNLPTRKSYDAYSNPLFYLLDNDARIIGNRISPSTVKKIILSHLQANL